MAVKRSEDIKEKFDEYLESVDFEKKVNKKNNTEDKSKSVLPYVFVSIDLCNSTKIKYRYSNWQNLIKNFVSRLYLLTGEMEFWKYNGDEILFFKDLHTIEQLVKIIESTYNALQQIRNTLKSYVDNDDCRDLIDAQATIWMAPISNRTNKYANYEFSKRELVFKDFSGPNLDEGFRLTKLAKRNRLLIDPKIAIIIVMASQYLNQKSSNVSFEKNFKSIFKKMDSSTKMVFSSLLKYCEEEMISTENNWDKREKINFSQYFGIFKESLNQCANNIRLVNFGNSKGVWDERPYPILWYSNNWDKIQEDFIYDESLPNIGKEKLYEGLYKKCGSKNSYAQRTCEHLSKICRDVNRFSGVLNLISNHQLIRYFSGTLYNDRSSGTNISLYFQTVCVCPELNAALILHTSNKRHHLPSTWDLPREKLKNSYKEFAPHNALEREFKDHFKLVINYYLDPKRNTIQPMALRPVYRRNSIYQAVLCFAKIDLKETLAAMNLSNLIKGNASIDNLSLQDKEIIEVAMIESINSLLVDNRSLYNYPYYDCAKFIHMSDFSIEEGESKIIKIKVNDKEIQEYSFDDEQRDAQNFDVEKEIDDENRAICQLSISVYDALKHYSCS